MNNLKKTIVVSLIGLSMLVVPVLTQALTADELQVQIDTLMAQLVTLQTQLADLQGEAAPTVTGCTITSFDRNLSVGNTGDDVKCLQIILNSTSDTQLATEGVGSSGSETTYFGPLTKSAVIKFQEKYTSDILATYGLTSGTGFVGTTTRAKLDTLLVAVSDDDDVVVVDDDDDVVVVAAGLTISLASDTPASVTIADSANANFTKFTLAAGSEGDVSISKIYVTRSGLTGNSDLENIKIVGADGVNVGSIGSLNVNSKAMITFTPSLVVEAGSSQSYYIRAGIVDAVTAGKTAILGIASGDDIISDASEVNGSVTGNAMSVVEIDIGSADLSEDGTTVNSQPDVGDSDITVNQFKVTAGSTEAITIEQITVMETGTASLNDIANIELYNVTDGETLGTVSGWNAEGKASWADLNIVISKGDANRFKIMVDIVGGSDLTINADISDGTDRLVTVKGNTYGFYITPGVTGGWDGKGSNDQSIQAGSLTVSKSSATPATGYIAPADDQELVTFDFTARGEEVKVSALEIAFDRSGIDCAEITNVKVYNETTGGIVAGPKDCDTDVISYTDTFIVPVGTTQYTVKAKIASTTQTLDSVEVAIDDPSSDITAKGMTSNDSVDPTPGTAVAGNTMTVAAGNLLATTLTSPVARNIAKGTPDFVWMTASLDATNSGENVLVTAITIYDTISGTGTGGFDDVDSAEIWADLTTGSSARGDVYETLVSRSLYPTAITTGSQAFSLTQTITVPKGTYIKVAFVGNLATGSIENDIHTVKISAVTATGSDTGTDVAVTPTGDGQGMTVKIKGVLTVSVDAGSSPTASILIGESTGQTLAVFRLAASNVEDLDLDSIKVTDTGAGDAVDTYYFYYGSTLIGSTAAGTTSEVMIPEGTVTIPADDYVLITVKGDMKKVDGTAIVNNDAITINIDVSGDIDATGLSSGAETDSTDLVSAATHDLYESRPYFSLNSSSPSGTLVRGTETVLAIFDITADSAKDITFNNDNDSNFLIVNISATLTDSDTNDETWTLRDGVNTLDTVTNVDIATASSITFDWSDYTSSSVDWVVSAGETRQLKVYADTTELGDAGDTIQLWLDASANDVDWGIDGAGSYNEGDKIFKGDILANALVTPSGSTD